jgi:hypothetical protein
MNGTNQATVFIRAILVFVFGLFATTFKSILSIFLSDTDTLLTIGDPLSKNLPQVSWTGLDETTDEGVKVVSKDGFLD